MSANSFDTNSFWLHVKYPGKRGLPGILDPLAANAATAHANLLSSHSRLYILVLLNPRVGTRGYMLPLLRS